MKFLALSTSPSPRSINHALLIHAASLLSGHEVEVVSFRDYLDVPLYRSDLQDAEGIPAAMTELHARITAADGLLLATPEYNGGMPGHSKNIIDWVSRVGRPFLPGPLLLLATSPGGRGGRGVLGWLEQMSPHWGADLVGSFSLPRFRQRFDAERGLVEEEDRARLQGLLDALVAKAEQGAAA